jgi:hypothetical protein
MPCRSGRASQRAPRDDRAVAAGVDDEEEEDT